MVRLGDIDSCYSGHRSHNRHVPWRLRGRAYTLRRTYGMIDEHNVVAIDGGPISHHLGEPDSTIVEILESALERAKLGIIVGISVVEVDQNGWCASNFYATTNRFTLMGGLHYALHRISCQVD